MTGTEVDIGTGPDAQGLRQLEVRFEFATGSKLVTGDRIIGFPSYVQGGAPVTETSIVIDALPDGSDHVALQQAVNRRMLDLATVTQALGLATAELARALETLGGH